MARIAYITEDTVDPELDFMFGEGKPRNISGLMAHARNNAVPLSDYLLSLLSKQKLDPQIREMCILYTARLTDCSYEWVQHESFAQVVGLAESDVAAIANLPDPSQHFEGLAAAALRLTKQLVTTGTADAENIEAVLTRSSECELTELILAVVSYQGLATFMRALAIDPEQSMPSGAASGMIAS